VYLCQQLKLFLCYQQIIIRNWKGKIPVGTSSHERKQKVLNLESYFNKSPNQKKKKEIENLVIDMIAVALQPLSMVCDS
jgi:hypothetical protein